MNPLFLNLKVSVHKEVRKLYDQLFFDSPYRQSKIPKKIRGMPGMPIGPI